MSQLSSPESPSNPIEAALNPTLRTALSSLDVQLEAELERYRVAATKTKPVPAVPPRPIAIEGQYQQPVISSPDADRRDGDSEAALSAQANAQTEVLPDVWSNETPGTADDTNGANGAIASSFEVNGSDRGDFAAGELPEPAPEPPPPPQDYLESAERLRDSAIAPDAGDGEDDDRSRRITPLGIGSILLFLAATATLAYVIVSPESLDRIGLDRRFGGDTASEADADASADAEPEPDADADPEPRLPTSPDLAAQEFGELDLNTLSGIDPEIEPPAPSPAPSPSATEDEASATDAEDNASSASEEGGDASEAAPNDLDNISALLTPESSGNASETTDEANDSTAASDDDADDSAEESRPTPTIDRDDNYDGFYFVVVNYDDRPATLDRVRSVVPDAYLREFPDGVKVQVGAFDDTASADELVDRLNDAGVSARVFQSGN